MSNINENNSVIADELYEDFDRKAEELIICPDCFDASSECPCGDI